MADPKCRVARCVISANSGGWAGGVQMGAAGKGGGILRCSIVSNNVGRGQNRNSGGGIAAHAGSQIRDCRVVNNACRVSGEGIYFRNGTVVSNCFIAANSYEH